MLKDLKSGCEPFGNLNAKTQEEHKHDFNNKKFQFKKIVKALSYNTCSKQKPHVAV